MIDYSEKTIARFWAKVARGAAGECWPWKAGKNWKGYGTFGGSSGGKQWGTVAPRYAYETLFGPLGDPKVFVLHSCDNPACCNPEHLSPGSVVDNAADMTARNRQSRGSNRPLSKLTEEQVQEAARLWLSGEKQHQIAKLFGVNQSQVSRALNRHRWRHVETGTKQRIGRRSCRARSVTLNGETKTVSTWIAELGLSAGAVRRRIQLGWDPVKALTAPLRKAG
jgi:NADH:ubiquinone oxidoreductase subunit E